MVAEIKTEKLTLELPQEVPDFLKDKLEKYDMLLYAKSLHKDFLPEPWQSKLAEVAVNQRTLWRHKDPENPEDRGDVFGRNLHEEVKNDGFSHTYYQIYGNEDPESIEMTLQSLIKKQLEANDPIGISKGFIIKRKNGEIFRVIALEDSITYKPACKQCITQEVIQMEDKEKLEEEIKKLQKVLDDHKLQLEEKEKAISEKTSAFDEVKTKLEELEAKLNAKDKAVESTKTEKQKLEDTLIKLSDEFKEFQEKVALERELAAKRPIIDAIFKLEEDEMLKEVYNAWDIKKLEGRLAYWQDKRKKLDEERRATIHVSKLEDDIATYKKVLGEKDVGPKALANVDAKDLKFLKLAEEDMKREGMLK